MVTPPDGFMFFGTSAESQPFSVPYPSINSTLTQKSRFVDSLRNNVGEVVGTAIGRASDAQQLHWDVLDPELWWAINRFWEDNGMFFWCRYFDFNLGLWRVRQFYVGDISAQAYMVDVNTNMPKYMRDCTCNVVDMGILGQ